MGEIDTSGQDLRRRGIDGRGSAESSSSGSTTSDSIASPSHSARRSASGATTALDVPQKPSAPQTQTQPGSLFHELEKIDQWLSHKIHTLCFGSGDYVVFVPAFVFSAYVIPLVLLATYFFMPIRAWTEGLLGW